MTPSSSASTNGLALARSVWLLLLAQLLGTLPVSATGIFLPAIAADLASDAAVVGGLRSLGGVAALACGVLVAPLVDRLARAWTVALGLVVLSAAALAAGTATLASLGLFFFLAAAGAAVLQPALQSAAADGRDRETGARAAALVSACAALSPMLAGPLLALPTTLWGWQGDFLALGVGSLLLAGLAAVALDRREPLGVARPSYRAAFALVASAPGAVPILLASTLRGTVQFAWLTYLAAYLAAAFGASTAVAAATWTLGGSAFFVANLAVGRLVAGSASASRSGDLLLPVTLGAAAILTPVGFIAPTLPLAMGTAALAAGAHGGAVAATISLLVGRYTDLRGPVLALNAAGLNLGLFVGAALGGLALGLGGYLALVGLLGLLGVAATAAAIGALRYAPKAQAGEALAPSA